MSIPQPERLLVLNSLTKDKAQPSYVSSDKRANYTPNQGYPLKEIEVNCAIRHDITNFM